MANNEVRMEDNSEVYTDDNIEVENINSMYLYLKFCVKRDNNIIRYRSLGCEFGGKYSSKKNIDINTYHDRKLKHQGCKWHVNLNFPKNTT
ncbi:3383_t:CDS:2, partial [Dentiscutata heterogama]